MAGWLDDLVDEDEGEEVFDSEEQGFNNTEGYDSAEESYEDLTQSYEDLQSINTDNNEKKITIGGKELGYKGVALLLCGVLIVLAIVVLFIDSIHISDKPKEQRSVQSTEVVQEKDVKESTGESTTSQTDNQKESQAESKEQKGTFGLKIVPEDTEIDYNVAEQTAEGQVTDKTKYVANGQLLYCLTVTLNDSGNRREVQYFCGFGVFSSLNIADNVTVKYQQVSEKTISVINLSQ